MVTVENWHYHGNSDHEPVVNSTTDPALVAVVGRANVTDPCAAVVALCAAEATGYAVVIPIICCVGILLNVLNLVILSTDRFPESSYSYLTALAVADLLSLFFFGASGVGRGHYAYDPGWNAFEAYVYFPLGSVATVASILLTVTVTVERYAFIYHPMRSKAWCNRATARKVVAAAVGVSAALSVPRFFAMRVGDKGRWEFTEFGRGEYYSSYAVCVYFGLVSVGSCLCLVVFNTLLVVGIHRTHRKRKSLVGSTAAAAKSGNKNQQDDATLTRTLVMVVCVFVAGELPSSLTSRSLFVALVGGGGGGGGGNHDLLNATNYRIAVLVSTALVVAQHSLNFVVYCVFNRRFYAVLRLQFLSLVRCSGKKPDLSLNRPSPKAAEIREPRSNNVTVSLVAAITEI